MAEDAKIIVYYYLALLFKIYNALMNAMQLKYYAYIMYAQENSVCFPLVRQIYFFSVWRKRHLKAVFCFVMFSLVVL